MKTHRYSLLSLLFILLLIFSACSSSSSNETESSQAESRLRYRMAFHIADDGWVYVLTTVLRTIVVTLSVSEELIFDIAMMKVIRSRLRIPIPTEIRLPKRFYNLP